MGEQPSPKPNNSTPIWELVIGDMAGRDRVGRKRYGVPLQAGNGRDALRDAYEESLDQVAYLRQAIEERKKKVIFCGRARAGKDTACELWSIVTGCRNAGTVSKYIAPHAAARLGLPVEEAYAKRGESMETRRFWRKVGDELMATDPALLSREMMQHGEVGGGLRRIVEIRAARAEGVADLFVWVDSVRALADTTCEFGPEECDITIRNDGTLEEFGKKIKCLARFANMGASK